MKFHRNLGFLSLMILSLLAEVTYADKVFQVDTGGTLTTGLISYYKFDGNSNDFYSTINGTDISITYQAGKVGQGAFFNASADQIHFGNNFNFTTGPFSVAGWIKYTSAIAGKFPAIFAKSDYNGSSDWELRFCDGGGTIALNFWGSTGGLDYANTTMNILDNTWHHVVGLRNGTNIKIYIDGIERASGIDNARNVSSTLNACIGHIDNGDHGYSSAMQDEWGVWSKALSSTEISNLYNGGAGQTMIETNPVPTTTSISPTYKSVGDAGFTLTVNGTNFIANSVVNFNGLARTTIYISVNQVTASILTSDLTSAGTFPITVFNPTPGGGTSNPQTFTIYQPLVIDWNNGNVQTITLQRNAGFTFTNGQPGGVYRLIIKQDNPGGQIVTFPSSIIKWYNDPNLSTSAGAIDMAIFTYDGLYYLGSFYRGDH